ncbi:MAG: hypothetical protein KF689_09640 [Gemmatimonadaceae bacterium]|nr:hypothetical protein [Gemmatimonadaceae bacterium]MCW5826139.1 hypothetical protein [Gemmatimonadaceae bacterium]
MLRVLVLVVATAVAADALEAQPTREALRWGVSGAAPLQNDERAPLGSAFVAKQLASAAGGMMLFSAAGALLSAGAAGSDAGLEDIGPAAITILAGAVLGSAFGVHWYSDRRGQQSPFFASLAGAAVGAIGLVGGGAVLVTMPVGAVVGYNVARR